MDDVHIRKMKHDNERLGYLLGEEMWYSIGLFRELTKLRKSNERLRQRLDQLQELADATLELLQ